MLIILDYSKYTKAIFALAPPKRNDEIKHSIQIVQKMINNNRTFSINIFLN